MATENLPMQLTSISHFTRNCVHDLSEATVDTSILPQEDIEWAESQLARLRLWADSLGVFASGLWSIEHRLRRNSETRRLVLQLLAAINADLHTWQRLRWGELQIPGTHSLEGEDSDDSSASQSERTIQRRIESDIGRLIRFSVQIRKARDSLTDQRVAKYDPLDSQGTPIVNEFLDHIKNMIHNVLPLRHHASHSLKQRLLDTMVLRWRRLMLQKQRAENLANVARPNEVLPIPTMQTHGTSGILTPTKQSDQFTSPQKPSESRSIVGATTLASSFKVATASHGKASSSGTLALKEDVQHLSFPKPPKVILSNEVECPFCHIPLAKADLVRTRWQNHVMHDLRPYICLYDECRSSQSTYRTSDAWLTHFRESHAIASWECQICRRSFHEAAQIIGHTRIDHHMDLSAAQAASLATTTRVQSPKHLHDCPFCVPGTFGKTDLANAEGQKCLLEHISKTHLMPLALMSIPFEFGDTGSDKATCASQLGPSSDAGSIDQVEVDMAPSDDEFAAMQRLDSATIKSWNVAMDGTDVLRERYFHNLDQAEPVESESHAEQPAPLPEVESSRRAEQTASLSERRYLDQTRNQHFQYDSRSDVLFYEDGTSRPRPDTMARSLFDSSTVPRSVAPTMNRASSGTIQTSASSQSKSTDHRTFPATPQASSGPALGFESSYTYGTTPTPGSPHEYGLVPQLSPGQANQDRRAPNQTEYTTSSQRSRFKEPVDNLPPSSSSGKREPPAIPKAQEREYHSPNGLRIREAYAPENEVRTSIATGDLNPSNRITDPALLSLGIRTQGILMGNGNEGEQERLFSTFKVRPHSFFCFGRVFMVLWVEPAGSTVVTNVERNDVTIPGRHRDEFVYSKVRRFVVIREGQDYCSALPIASYGHRGVGKRGVNKSEHAIIYTKETPPSPLPAEIPQRGESGMRPNAIRVVPDNPTDRLDPVSRIDFAKIYTVQHNVKTRSFGMVHPSSSNALQQQFRNACYTEAPVVPSSSQNAARASSSRVTQELRPQPPLASTGRRDSQESYVRSGSYGAGSQRQADMARSTSGGSVRSGTAPSIASRGARTIAESLEEEEDEEDDDEVPSPAVRSASRLPQTQLSRPGDAATSVGSQGSSLAEASRGAQDALARMMREDGASYQEAVMALIRRHMRNHRNLTQDQAKTAVLNLLNYAPGPS